MFGCLRTARGAVDAVVIDGVVTSILALTYNDDTGALRETGFCRRFYFRPCRSQAIEGTEYAYEY
jgi:hypothetical protein